MRRRWTEARLLARVALRRDGARGGSAARETKILLLHVGLPKVASTTLQLGLFDQHPDLASVHHLSKDAEKKEIADFAGRFFRQDEPLSKGERVSAYRRLHHLLKSHQSLVVSHEGFTTSWRRKVLAVRLFADELAKSDRGASMRPRVLLFYRPYEELLWSAYVQACFYKEPAAPIPSYRTWAQKLLQESGRRDGRLRIGDMIQAYARWFGRENVLVVSLSSLAQDPLGTYRAISDFAGLGDDPALFTKLAEGRQHNSWQSKLRKKPELKEPLEGIHAEGLGEQMGAQLSTIEREQLAKLKNSGVRLI